MIKAKSLCHNKKKKLKPLTVCEIPIQNIENIINYWTGNNLYFQSSQNEDIGVCHLLPGKKQLFFYFGFVDKLIVLTSMKYKGKKEVLNQL